MNTSSDASANRHTIELIIDDDDDDLLECVVLFTSPFSSCFDIVTNKCFLNASRIVNSLSLNVAVVAAADDNDNDDS
jgi:hypothetical protein